MTLHEIIRLDKIVGEIMTRNYKTCPICGRSFPCPPSDKTVTCGKDCSRIHRSRMHQGKSNIWSDEARKQLAKKGQTDNLKLGTAAGVKTWHLISPGGKHYRFKNLAHWAMENYTLFGFHHPNDAEKVRCGISNAKGNGTTYKDWKAFTD